MTIDFFPIPIDTPLCDAIHGANSKEPYVSFHLVKTTVLFLLQATMSLGSTAVLALGVGLLDESVTPTRIPACIGVVIGSSLLGLQTGLMVGKYAFHVSAEFNLAGDIAWLGECSSKNSLANARRFTLISYLFQQSSV